MLEHNDEALVAYLDGELDPAGRRDVEAWLAADPALGERLAALAQAGELARSAFADIVDEPIPERLIAAARGATLQPAKPPSHEAEILVLRPRAAVARLSARHWRIGLAAMAAGLFGILFGGAGTYFGMGFLAPVDPAGKRQIVATAENNLWLDNAAGYYKLIVSAGDNMMLDEIGRAHV